MEFGKHLGKGLWGIADKALPVIYGVSYVVLVIRVLPEEEFGSFVLLQEIFLILSNLAAAFALHPLLKFATETTANHREVIGAAGILNLLFIAAASLLAMALKGPLALVLNAPALDHLMIYVVAMLLANLVRNFTLVLLQSRFQVQRVFWIDAAHFLVAPALIYTYSKLGIFDTAYDLVIINVMSLTLSSLVGWWMCRGELHFTLKPRRDEMRRMWDFGKYSIGNVVSTLFISKADSFILSAFTGPVQVAIYNSVKVFTRLYDMVPQVIQMFVFPAASRLSSAGELPRLKVIAEKAITFTTVAMVPVFLLLLFFSPLLIGIVYQGRYAEAIPMLQIFSLLAFLTPATAVASNVLMGLGEVRLNFVLNAQVLVVSTVIFLLLIPPWGPVGASIAFVFSAIIQTWIFTCALRRHISITLREILRRTSDIKLFVLAKLSR